MRTKQTRGVSGYCAERNRAIARLVHAIRVWRRIVGEYEYRYFASCDAANTEHSAHVVDQLYHAYRVALDAADDATAKLVDYGIDLDAA